MKATIVFRSSCLISRVVVVSVTFYFSSSSSRFLCEKSNRLFGRETYSSFTE